MLVLVPTAICLCTCMFVICMLLQMQKGQCFITKEFDMWKEISSLVYSKEIEIKLCCEIV